MTPPPMVVTCARNHRYETEDEAQAAIQRKRRQWKIELHIVECPYCGGLHLVKRKPDNGEEKGEAA